MIETKQQVVIEIRNGIINVLSIPQDVCLTVIDWDNQEESPLNLVYWSEGEETEIYCDNLPEEEL